MNQATPDYDLLIIGGGINGVGIARDAAGRGLRVLLCEKSDLAAATSSWSSKLIHGGLRYLENYDFGLVRKSLKEREVLARAAPHIIRPMAFQIPMLEHSRSSLLVQIGLLFYDNLAKRERFKGSRSVKYGENSPLNSVIKKGFEYWDAQVDDSRLVILNAMSAAEKGAHIRVHTECTGLQVEDGMWRATLHDHVKNRDLSNTARVVVNASGPWVSELHERLLHDSSRYKLRLVKGSHIVVPRLYEEKNAFLLQHNDGRVVFVIPYLGNYSLIGTTEEEITGNLDQVEISAAEINYLLSITNLYFRKSIRRDDIVHSFSGVRPLIDGEKSTNASKVSRDYQLVVDKLPAPMLSIYGGKVTTYRELAEQAIILLGQFVGRMPGSWTKKATLPGGDFKLEESLFQELASKHGWLGPDLINRWLHTYGTLSFDIVRNLRSMGDLGVCFGANLYQREVDYLRQREWAQTAEDILWRRTKLGYRFSDKEVQSLRNYLQQTSQ